MNITAKTRQLSNNFVDKTERGVETQPVEEEMDPLENADEDDQVLIRNVTYEDFSQICRTCLSPANLNAISDISYGQFKLTKLLEDFVFVKVEPEDNMPKSLCSSCLMKLIGYSDFREKCQNVEQLLVSIKEEQLLGKDQREVECANEDITFENNGMDISEEKEEEEFLQNDAMLENLDPIDFETYTKDGLLKCHDCGESFATHKQLFVHKKEVGHVRERKFSCNVCDKTFTNKYNLKLHMQLHDQPEMYKCNICLKRFTVSSNLKRHMMIHTGEKPHVCEVCGKGFNQNTSLESHRKVHEYNISPATCKICGRTFKEGKFLKMHMRRHNTDIHTKKKSGDELFQCEMCDKVYESKGALKTHQAVHGEKGFLCTHCGKAFFRKNHLEAHLRSHTGEKPFKCHLCPKTYTCSNGLYMHMQVHRGEKPYPCQHCDKSFRQQPHLIAHTRTHTGERPYTCTVCNKSFALNGNLTVHMRMHTGETPYKCSVCGRGFYDSSSMKKHERGCGGHQYVRRTVKVQQKRLPKQEEEEKEDIYGSEDSSDDDSTQYIILNQ